MLVDAINGSSSSEYSTNSTNGSTLDKQAFLSLLTAQLKHQDPLEPMDNTEYVAQLAQFSSLEQLWNIDDTLKESSDATQSMSNSLVPSLLGKEILVSGDTLVLQDDYQMGFTYNLEQDADVTISIYDQYGKMITKIESGEQNADVYGGIWDGTDALGNTMPEGDYTFKVMAVDANGNESAIDTQVYGVVSSIKYVDGLPVLMLGNAEFSTSDIVEIR